MEIKKFFNRFFRRSRKRINHLSKDELTRYVENIYDGQDISFLLDDITTEKGSCMLDPNDRIYTINIKNTSDVKQKVILFGSLQKNLNDRSIKIRVLESSYRELIADLLSTTVIVGIVKIIAKDKKQFANYIKSVKKETTGCEETRIIQPLNYFSIEDSEKYIPCVELKGHAFVISKLTRWEFDINPKEDISIVLYLLAKIELRKTLIYIK
jgi:hypothetical protein